MYSLAASQSFPLTGWEVMATIIFLLLSLVLWIWSLISIQVWLGNVWVTGFAAVSSSVFLSGLTNGWASIAVGIMGLIGAFSRSFLEGFILLILQTGKIALIISVISSVLSRIPGWEMTLTL